MQKGIHPEISEITVTCTCGAKVETRSTKKDDYSVVLNVIRSTLVSRKLLILPVE